MTKTQQAELKEFLENHKTTEATSFNQQIARNAARMAAFEDCNYHTEACAMEERLKTSLRTGDVPEEEKREAICYDAELSEQYFIAIADKFPRFKTLKDIRQAELFVMAAMDRLNPDYLEALHLSTVIQEKTEFVIVDTLSPGGCSSKSILVVCFKENNPLTSIILHECQVKAEATYEAADDDSLKDTSDYFKDALVECGFDCTWKTVQVISLYNRKKK
jgi:hypothetical protein